MSDKKYTYPKGIYANRYPDTPGFVRSNIKIDNAKAIAWLQANPDPFTFLQILQSRTPDDYGNLDYICVDDYATSKERRKAKEGLAAAKNVVETKEAITANEFQQKGNRPIDVDFPEDDIPF